MELVTDPTVISVDPGGTTGWSLMVVHPEALVDPEVSILDNMTYWTNGQLSAQPGKGKPSALELSYAEMMCVKNLMKDVLVRWAGAALVIEDFILRKASMDRELLSPVRITSVLEWAVMEAGLNMSFHRQTPQMAKSTATDERLKSWGLYLRTGAQRHARDGDRHSITFLRACKASGALRGRAWPHLYLPSGDIRPGVLAAT